MVEPFALRNDAPHQISVSTTIPAAAEPVVTMLSPGATLMIFGAPGLAVAVAPAEKQI